MRWSWTQYWKVGVVSWSVPHVGVPDGCSDLFQSVLYASSQTPHTTPHDRKHTVGCVHFSMFFLPMFINVMWFCLIFNNLTMPKMLYIRVIFKENLTNKVAGVRACGNYYELKNTIFKVYHHSFSHVQ